MPVWTTIIGTIRKDLWWRLTLIGLVAYLAWQATVLATAALAFLGGATGRCLIGFECDIFTGPAFLVAVKTLATVSFSIAILGGLWRLLRALWAQALWTAVVCRLAGWATLVPALLFTFVTPYAVGWVMLAAWLIMTGGRLSAAPYEDPNILEAERV